MEKLPPQMFRPFPPFEENNRAKPKVAESCVIIYRPASEGQRVIS